MASAAGVVDVLQTAVDQLEAHRDISGTDPVGSSVAVVMAVVATTNYSLSQLPPGVGVSDDITLLIQRWVGVVHRALTEIVDACDGATFTLGVSGPLVVTASVTLPRQPLTADVA
jgi:hypothetical protein